VLDRSKAQQKRVWYYRFELGEEPAPFNDITVRPRVFDLRSCSAIRTLRCSAKQSPTRPRNRPGRLATLERLMAKLGAFSPAPVIRPNARKRSAYLAD
jgi:hypothetical protein